ncbi:MAG: threonine synthase [Candidatus Latescibacteria bacterium]|jgi:threonine synthase|nr:threonine synthase [Candidatus Latescibacterota bacterium]
MSSLICAECKKYYQMNEPVWRCECGGLLDIDHSPSFPVEKISRRKPDMWRYREAIPVDNDENIVSFGEGFTPLLEIELFGTSVAIKQDYLFPTGSFKDRGASVLISKVKELGIDKIIEDSSGNAGAAIAAYAARAAIACDIYVPESTSGNKLAQIKLYGANIHTVEGTREDTANAALAAVASCNYASHSWNPYFFQGTKTVAYEICEQLGWKSPDTVVVPVGNGTLLLGAYIGFHDLFKAGIIRKMPKLVGVQSALCAPLYSAFKKVSTNESGIKKEQTIAEGIAVSEPVRLKQIIDAVRESRGDFIVVEEEEIIEALKVMSRKGFYCEPTSAAAIAGLKKYINIMCNDELIVSVITGHGLKAPEKIGHIIL